MKKIYKIGDIVTTTIVRASSKKNPIIIKGKIKSIRKDRGLMTYTITEGVAKDFLTRIIK